MAIETEQVVMENILIAFSYRQLLGAQARIMTMTTMII